MTLKNLCNDQNVGWREENTAAMILYLVMESKGQGKARESIVKEENTKEGARAEDAATGLIPLTIIQIKERN